MQIILFLEINSYYSPDRINIASRNLIGNFCLDEALQSQKRQPRIDHVFLANSKSAPIQQVLARMCAGLLVEQFELLVILVRPLSPNLEKLSFRQ